jgi:hypothetical protein
MVNRLKKVPKSEGGTEGAMDTQSIVNSLSSSWDEADNARRSGPNPRDDKWQENLDLYWNRYDFSGKAPWQAQVVMPEVPNFVDRFASAMKEAMVAVPEGFYTIADPTDTEGDVTKKVKAMLDVWLSQSGTAATGQPLGFPAVFEEQMKLGAILACCGVVEWKRDVKYGRVTLETVDPRFVWQDPTGRAQYRIRRYTKDRTALKEMIGLKDSNGNSIFRLEDMGALVGHIEQNDQLYMDQLAGHGQEVTSPRAPITFDEYYARIIGPDGKPLHGGRTLTTVAQKQFLVRGPEVNPYWHGQDWVLYAPLVTVPMSVYGRSYMEDFGAVARAYTELTNLLLDAVFTSSLKAFVMVPGLLLNPQQASEGIHPNKQFLLEEGVRPEDFAKALDLGNLPAEAITMWQSLKAELRESANMNEIGLGQFAPNGRTSATEVSATQQSSSAVIRSIAQTVETRFLEPALDLMWKTGLQFMSKEDPALSRAAGPAMFQALFARRKELVSSPITFQARGISTLIQKSQKLRAILGLLQIIASNPQMAQSFFQAVDMRRLVTLLFDLSDIDLTKLQTSERDQLIRSITEPMQQAQAAQGGAPGGGQQPSPGQSEAASVASLMGVARG